MKTARALAASALLALALPSGGCCSLLGRFPGTCGSYADDVPIYPGIALYGGVASRAFGERYCSDRGRYRVAASLLWIDLPASVALDTALLPIDILLYAGRGR